jgi:hypothetical protein
MLNLNSRMELPQVFWLEQEGYGGWVKYGLGLGMMQDSALSLT